MNIEFIKELDGNYLVLQGEPDGNAFERNMLLHTRPAGLLPFRLFRTGEEPAYSYEISGRQSLSSLTQTSEIDEKMMRDVLYSIHRSCEEAASYLLRPSGLVLEPGLIFRGREGWSFVYHPDRDEDLFAQLQKLSRFFLKKCNHEDEKTARVAYELLRVCHEENTTFSQIFELWDEIAPEPRPVPKTAGPQPARQKRGLFRRTRSGRTE